MHQNATSLNDGATPVAERNDPMQRLADKAAEAREQWTATEIEVRSDSWFDPDPAAAVDLAERHPVNRVIANSGGRNDRGQGEVRSALRRGCERIQGLPLGSLSHDDVLAYPWHHLDEEAAARFKRTIDKALKSQGGRNEALSVVRRVVTESHKVGLIGAGRHADILDALPTRSVGASRKRRRLSTHDINALLLICLDEPGSRCATRDAAIIAVLATTGMRGCEIVDLDLEDWDRIEQTLYIAAPKNGRPHHVPVHPVAAEYLEAWVALRGEHRGPLMEPNGGPSGKPMHTSSIRGSLHKRADTAGVRRFGLHDFRRTVATEMLRQTKDVALVSRLLNHLKIDSTLIYDLAGEDDLRSAVLNLDLGTGLPPAAAPVTTVISGGWA